MRPLTAKQYDRTEGSVGLVANWNASSSTGPVHTHETRIRTCRRTKCLTDWQAYSHTRTAAHFACQCTRSAPPTAAATRLRPSHGSRCGGSTATLKRRLLCLTRAQQGPPCPMKDSMAGHRPTVKRPCRARATENRERPLQHAHARAGHAPATRLRDEHSFGERGDVRRGFEAEVHCLLRTQQ